MIDKRSCLVYACHAKRLYPLLVNWARMQADRTVGALPYYASHRGESSIYDNEGPQQAPPSCAARQIFDPR